MFVTRNVWKKYHSPQNGDGGEGGGGGGSGDGSGGTGEGSGEGGGDGKGGEGSGEGEGSKSGDGSGEGSRKPTDEEARLLKENMKRKKALDDANAELARAREALAKFDGIDPAAVRKLLDDQKAAEEKQLEAKGEWDRLKARMAEEHTKEVKTLQDQIKALQDQLNNTQGTIKELSVGQHFAQSKFISEELTLTPGKARVIYGEYFDVEDGKVVGYDKPRGAANRTALVDQYGNTLDFESAMKKIVDADPEKDHLLKSKVKPGAGSSSTKQTTQTKKEEPTDSISKIGAGLKGLKVV